MRISEICKILRVRRTAVIRWIKIGQLKATKIKAKKGVEGCDYWDISKQDFDDYLKKLN